ncbi:MAG TPA: hypothetical protein VK158_04135 [Acidobacteriota bacterium]|nr:hypothetical protein [Acidobacteriota bacterium]
MGNDGNILESFLVTSILVILLSFILVPILYVPNVPVSTVGTEITSVTRLVDSVRMNDGLAQYGQVTKQEYFPIPAQELRINADTIYAFEFKTTAAAMQMASQISSDGGTISGKQISWIGQPHFFRSGPLLVLYVGDNRDTLSILMYLLGNQFAGIVPYSTAACSIANPCDAPSVCYVFAGESLCLDVDPCTLCGEKSCTIAKMEPAQIFCQ